MTPSSSPSSRVHEDPDLRVVVARWSALGVESVDADSLVTLKLSHLTVAEVLNEVLDELSEVLVELSDFFELSLEEDDSSRPLPLAFDEP